MPTEQKSGSTRRWIVWSLRVVMLVVVGAGVSGTVHSALDQLEDHEWHVRPAWLAVAGLLYIAGLMPMAWYWYRCLAALQQPAPWAATLRAYFLGHLGKYVPGKAMSVIMRIAAVRKWTPSMRLAILSTMLETLTMMAVGASLAAVLSMFLLRSRPELAAMALLVALCVGLPTLPPIARWLARLGVNRMKRGAVEAADAGLAVGAESSPAQLKSALSGINTSLLLQGWAAAGVCWVFLGWSLWATLRAIGVEQVSAIGDLASLIAAVALAVVAGFVSMLPGGLGVRDLALVQLLAESCGPADALVAAIMLRLVWLVSELTACVILYIAAKNRVARTASETESG